MPRFVRSDEGVRIAYEVRGAGHPALVLVHGWSCDRGYWLAQLEALSREFLVVTLDLAGHGESDSGRREWSIVASVVRRLALEEVVLVGHSMGGDVILEAARRLPGLVDALVWVDTYRELPNCSAAEEVERRMAPFRTNFVAETRGLVRTMFGAAADPSLVARIARDMSAAPIDVALAALEAAWSFGAAVPDLLRMLGLPLIALNPADGAADIEFPAPLRHRSRLVARGRALPDAGRSTGLQSPARERCQGGATKSGQPA